MLRQSGGAARIEGQAFDAKSWFTHTVGILFLVAIYLTLLRSLVYGVLAVMQKFKQKKIVFDSTFQPPVSVLITPSM